MIFLKKSILRRSLVLAVLFFIFNYNLKAQDYNFTSAYDVLRWPVELGLQGGITGDDGSYKKLVLFHGNAITFETGTNAVNFSNTRVTIDANGKVGIGTTSPNYILDVNGTSNVTGQSWFSYGNNNMSGYSWTNAALTTNSIEIVNNNGTVNNLSPTLVFHRYGSGGPQFRLAADGSNVLYLESAGANSSRSPVPYGGGPNNYFSRLHIDGGLTTVGNVGIGTTTPHQKLDLNGGSITMGDLNSTGAISFRNDIPVGAAGSVGISAIDAANNGNNDGLGLNVSDGLKIINGPDTYLTLLSSTGNVGIGITNPQEKLAVNGTIHSKQVTVDLLNWPDYVFQPTYHLKPISEVKTYIDQNQHLPDMPSAAEVEKDGVNLGEMNKILTKKVEELTLYLIEKDKEIKELKTSQEERLKILEQRLQQLEK